MNIRALPLLRRGVGQLRSRSRDEESLLSNALYSKQ